jgi:hypothetical protein
MANRRVTTLNGKELSGELVHPIDHGLYMPLCLKEPLTTEQERDWALYLEAKETELRRQRMAKMPALARHLGIDVDAFMLSADDGLGGMMLYATIAEKLAAELIPGFQEKPTRGKHAREIVRLTRKAIDAVKSKTSITDFDAAAKF